MNKQFHVKHMPPTHQHSLNRAICGICGGTINLARMTRTQVIAWYNNLYSAPRRLMSVDEKFISYREAQALVESERERCAGVAESAFGPKWNFVEGKDAAEWIALQIRKGTE